MKNMKRVSFYLLILFAAFLPAIQSSGQSDPVKTELNSSGEVVKNPGNKDTAEIGKFSDKQVNENEKTLEAKGYPDYQPTAVSITVWIFMSWTFFLILISIPFYFNHKKIKERQVIITNLIEKGHEIPKELLTPSSGQGRSDLHKGLILNALGLSVIIVLLSLNIPDNYWTIGLIPMLIGVAYLISFKFDKPAK